MMNDNIALLQIELGNLITCLVTTGKTLALNYLNSVQSMLTFLC